jgi:hypothetical protein
MKDRYLFEDPPAWIKVLIKLRNGEMPGVVVVIKPRTRTIEEFMDWALVVGRNLQQMLMFGKLKREEMEPWQAILLKLADDPESKRKLFLKHVRNCKACHRAFWPPKSISRLCEICRLDPKVRKATSKN